MAHELPKPIFHVILTDGDRWAVEAEWPDNTLERVLTFGSYSLASEWIVGHSEVWLRGRRSGVSFLIQRRD